MRRPVRPTKKASQRQHAKARAFERYGLTLTTRDLDELVATIIACWRKLIDPAPARLVVRQSQRVTVWKLECKGVPVQVVYDQQRRVIFSFLPYNMMPCSATERARRQEVETVSGQGEN